MSKKGRVFVISVAVLVQLFLGFLYGFSEIPVSECGCFILWCACAVMIYRVAEIPEIV